MSKQAAAGYLEKVASDPKLRQQSIDRAVQAGAKLGHKFTDKEFKQALQEKWGTPKPASGIEPYYCCC